MLVLLSPILQLQPNQVYFVGGFGVLSKWIPVEEYEVTKGSYLPRKVSVVSSRILKSDLIKLQVADPDILAHEVSRIVNRINNENEQELRLMCRHFLNAKEIDQVQATSVDRLGIDLR